MSTPAQILANRNNSSLSTGPRTDSGKQRSAANANSHGLSAATHNPVLPNENQSDYDALAAAYQQDFLPTTANESFLVHQMTAARWRLNRIERLQTTYLTNAAVNAELDANTPPTQDQAILARMTANTDDPYAALERYAAPAERSYFKAHKHLQTSRESHAIIQAKTATIEAKTAAKQAEMAMYNFVYARPALPPTAPPTPITNPTTHLPTNRKFQIEPNENLALRL